MAAEPDAVRASAVIKTGVRTQTRVTIVPDGLALVRVAGEHQVLAVEIDMGTVPVIRMWRRYRAYFAWWRLGSARLRYGPVPYRVLTLVPDAKRLESLRQAALRAPEKGTQGSRLFWFATLAAADIHAPERVLDPVWQVATRAPTPPQSLFPTLS